MAGFTLMSIILFIGIYLVQNLRIPVGIAYYTENLDTDILATTLSAESQSKSLFTAIIALFLVCSASVLLTTPLYLIKKQRQAG